jgi:tight adherence protein B
VVLAIEEVGVPADPVTAWRTWRAAGLTVIAIMFGAAPILAVMVFIAGAAAPIVLRPILEGRRWHRRDAQLPDVLERLGSELRAGSALGSALAVLGDSTPGPLGEELRSTGVEIRHGAALTTALDHWAQMPHASSDVRLAAAALGLGAEAGGEVARSVDRVAATLRERHELRAEVRALATQARASAGVLALAPLGFTALVSTIEPQAVHFLIATPVGVGCLLGGLGLEAAGAAWMARILGSAS